MSTSKSQSRLGRGLGALIASGAGVAKKPEPAAPAPAAAGAARAPAAPAAPAVPAAPVAPALPKPDGFAEIPVAAIEPNPHQPRKTIEPAALAELAESIRAEGLLQPILVRKVGEKYQLIAGERRWRAFQHLKIKTIPARLIVANDATSAAIALVENLQRQDLNAMEEAFGYASLIRDFDLTQELAAERVGKARASVANALRLLQLDAEIQGYISKGLLSVGHAKVLLGLENAAERQLLARRVIEEGLSVRVLEQLVQRRRAASSAPSASASAAGRPVPAAEATAVASIEKKLTSHFSARVSLKHSPKKGKIVIEYQGNTDLQRILDRLGVTV
ncbi:MAG: ParB/RepB/Spo0J family partition protein [Opitutaceae bacterium]|nr:ParB/RepB/Spo0J family partition protein [Opitutaceae bacterium]